MGKEYLTIDDLAQYLNMRRSTVYSWVENKQIPFFRFGRLLRFRREEIDAWTESHREKTIDLNRKAKEIFKGVKRSRVDIDVLVKKTIEEVKNSRYNLHHGKRTEFKGLGRKEVEDGTL